MHRINSIIDWAMHRPEWLAIPPELLFDGWLTVIAQHKDEDKHINEFYTEKMKEGLGYYWCKRVDCGDAKCLYCKECGTLMNPVHSVCYDESIKHGVHLDCFYKCFFNECPMCKKVPVTYADIERCVNKSIFE